jgi:serine/threonine protein kinase
VMDSDMEKLLLNQSGTPPAGRELPYTVRMQLLEMVAGGMAHLHANEVFHFDLKSANVLIKEQPDNAAKPFLAKVADFGMEAIGNSSATGEEERRPVGTPEYMVRKTAVIEAPCLRFTSDCQRFGLPQAPK